ncbi:hypothetical protein LINPERHAP2_LOCUS36864 [Linum perenne]
MVVLILAAAQKRWKFPVSCVRSTHRRTLKLSSFDLRGTPVLKLTESRGSDFSFFVLLPADLASRSWSELFRFTQHWIASLDILPPPPLSLSSPPSGSAKSYAQAVGGSFSLSGACGATSCGSSTGILVEKVGVADRQSYLDQCIVFRFLSTDSVDWASFHRWTHRSWGIPVDTHIQKLGDGLWLMHCGSSKKIRGAFRRGGGLGHYQGHSPAPSLQRLIPSVRRFLWLLPQFREWGSLSSVRIRFRLKGSIPEEIPICYEDRIYPVSVVLDAPPPSRSVYSSSNSAFDWREKKKSICSLAVASSSQRRSSVPHVSFPSSPVDFAARSATSSVFSTGVEEPSITDLIAPPKAGTLTKPAAVSLPQFVLSAYPSPNPPRYCCSFVGFRLEKDGSLLLSQVSRLRRTDLVLLPPVIGSPSLSCLEPLRTCLPGRQAGLWFGHVPSSPPSFSRTSP